MAQASELNSLSVISKGTCFVETNVDDEIVLMHTETGKFLRLVDTGKRVWQLIDTAGNYGEIVTTLLAEYDVSDEACRSETDRLIEQLEGQSLVSIH